MNNNLTPKLSFQGEVTY